MTHTLGDLTKGLKEWNKIVYGHIGEHKQKLLSSLKKTQHEVERSSSALSISKEMDIRSELEKVLDQEELLRKQKSKCDWLSLGDRNTKFFHIEHCKEGKQIASMLSEIVMAFDSMNQRQFNQKQYRFFKSCMKRVLGT